ncbi:hypothetical protein SH528x_003829 [Novipirellula sp. SH528]|uniref:hypothetical protein n=1 Tax=Novipirellula sp. SH528 TaxID=3454466 RepID=UPI003F9F5D77
MFSRKWIDEQIAPVFEDVGIKVSESSRDLLVLALNTQIEEGLVENPRALARAIEALPLEDLPAFYRMKYGNRTLSFNRTVRLLADLHERWIDSRHLAEDCSQDSE